MTMFQANLTDIIDQLNWHDDNDGITEIISLASSFRLAWSNLPLWKQLLFVLVAILLAYGAWVIVKRAWARVRTRFAAPGSISSNTSRDHALVPSPGREVAARSTALTQTVGHPTSGWTDPIALRSHTRRPAWMGYLTIFVFLFGLGVWASVAPLAGGAIAPGFISPEGSKKTVQHLEGGIIRDLLVRDGDVVQVGQPLLVLEKVQPQANFEVLTVQRKALLAKQIRLIAEQSGDQTLEFAAELFDAGGKLHEVAESQRQIFETRREMYSTRRGVLRQRIRELGEQIKGHESQIESYSRQLVLIREEIEGKLYLLKKGLMPKPEALRVRRMEEDIFGKRAASTAEMAQAKQQMGEAKLQLLSMDAERLDDIANELDKTRVDLANITERLVASEDILQRTTILAPVNGEVVNLQFKTKGGIVQKGEPILDIVPSDDILLIEARVALTDIDIVHAGLPAKIQFSAYSMSRTPQIEGIVTSVSADHIVDPNTERAYYLARVEVNAEDLKKRAPKVKLVPGMPAEVTIVTEMRTMMDILLQPFRTVLRRGLREA